VGVASGLSYLHGQSEDGKQGGAPVYHRDIKVGTFAVPCSTGLSLLRTCTEMEGTHVDYGLAWRVAEC
jgi:serine/threonine protein kinase